MKMLKELHYQIFKNLRPEIYKIQSFTYYIPGPPARRTGYREKEFDSVFYKLINLGFEIIDFKIVNHNSEIQSGFWACFILRAKSKESSSLDFTQLENELEVQLPNQSSLGNEYTELEIDKTTSSDL